jgi:hypothetical protein
MPKGARKLLPIKRVVRAELKDTVDSETLRLLAAYQEWHKQETGDKEAPSYGEVVDAAVREQVLGLSGFKAFLKDYEVRQQTGAGRRGRSVGPGPSASPASEPAASASPGSKSA